MLIIKSFFSAFLMYSQIPMPQVEWKEENRRYALCFFPLIGVVIGVLLYAWYWLCSKLNISEILFSVIAVAIPVLVTGGIHLDGFCDVQDAKASWGDREKLLEIMSDSHIGAFAVIKLALYFLIQAGLFSQINSSDIMLICCIGFVQSRAFSSMAVISFKGAKTNGTLQSFSSSAHKNITFAAEIFYLVATAVLMLYINPISGIFAIFGGVSAMLYYKRFSYKKFGGITGDLAGYFLEICEISIMAYAIFSDLIYKVIV